jgi:hypothetical protein
MTEQETMGEVIDENGTPPPGFSLDAETSRTDSISPGIIERTIEPEPEDDELPEIIGGIEPAPDDGEPQPVDDSGDAPDDDVIDDPLNATPLDDI